jgi:hypothetical protein
MFRQKLHINFQLAKEFTIYVTTQGRGNSPTALSVPFLVEENPRLGLHDLS